MNFLLLISIFTICGHVSPANVTVRTDCECGVSNLVSSGRIVSGVQTSAHQYPWMALMFQSSGSPYCGGAVLTNRHILTAAHCVIFDTDPYTHYWKIGIHDSLDEKSPKHYMEKIINHPNLEQHRDYDDYDMTIVLLKDTLEFSHTIRPLCLPHPNDDFTGKFATIAGWGRLSDESGAQVSRFLQETKVRILSLDECIERTQDFHKKYNFNFNKDSMICAYAPSTDACQIDSGGPIFYEYRPNKYVIFGVISFGIGCAKNFPGIYGRVTTSLDWIQKTIEESRVEMCKK